MTQRRDIRSTNRTGKKKKKVGGGESKVPVYKLTSHLWTREAKESLLEDGVACVPEGEAEAEPPLTITHARQPVLAPPVRPRTSMVVWEVRPTAYQIIYMQYELICRVMICSRLLLSFNTFKRQGLEKFVRKYCITYPHAHTPSLWPKETHSPVPVV